MRDDAHSQLREAMQKAADAVDPTARRKGPALSSSRIRQRGLVGLSKTAKVALVEGPEGILRWTVLSAAGSTQIGGRRAVSPNPDGQTIWEREIQSLGTNAVIAKLQDLDHHLNGTQGLWKVGAGGSLSPVEELSQSGPLLVLIHGTFSRSSALIDELQSCGKDQEFLGWANANYKQVLVFDHATLSVSPLLNALEIAKKFSNTNADIDVVCHSRGGLVTRWWLEVFDQAQRKRRRAVMVGCTLKGTSLAAPGRLRSGIDHLSNVIRVVGMIASNIPLAAGIGGLMTIAASVVGVAAHAPAIDALFAMVPGLAAMSRTSNNSELDQLQSSRGNAVEYFGVKSNFEPEDVPLWKFWRIFNCLDGRVKNALADTFVFRDDSAPPKRLENDLVVDCAAMDGIVPYVTKQWCDFGKSHVVHHTNYFSQGQTVAFIKDMLRN